MTSVLPTIRPQQTPAWTPDRASSIRQIGLLVLDNFSMVALSCAIEVLRTANRHSETADYAWSVLALRRGAVRSVDGTAEIAAIGYDEAAPLDLVLVCGGTEIEAPVDDALIGLLHRIAGDGAALGGVCNGAYALAKAGLLDGYRCALQRPDLPRLRREHPDVVFLERLAVIDRDRMTCGGGIATVDMMLSLVARRLGRELANTVSKHVGLPHRADGEHACVEVEHQTLATIIALMQTNLEEPLSAQELASHAGISLRHVQRMFQLTYGTTLSHYYLSLRLRRAREMVTNSSLSLTEIAVACGFASPAHFSRTYKAQYGKAPSAERPPK
ncbi:GlxA family transcriptional regulator [Methyloligella sp. 2.7D]|uniref:GlxA family transcriptional regulator n=1 Tax=unclassified Methyloligella TaxID=2625955 RepID=UPI00157BBE50|nr:GlxA family transcriptional regulator [Methyloligella sp. GL2]QKP75999.1 GlxA family transcriptional regulator [Methyloligella sp. GL2]